jgi:hypothetical protein
MGGIREPMLAHNCVYRQLLTGGNKLGRWPTCARLRFSIACNWFTCVQLLYPYLICSRRIFPKRSAPWLFTKAALGGFMPPPESAALVAQLTNASTILFTAYRTKYYRCSASRHTMKCWGLRATGLIQAFQ